MPCERTATCNIFCDSQLVPSGRDWIFLTRKSAKASQWHSFYLSNPTLSLGVLQASGGLQSWALELEREFTFFFSSDEVLSESFSYWRRIISSHWIIHMLSGPTLPQGLAQAETKNWKGLRGAWWTFSSFPLTPAASVQLNLNFLCWTLFHLHKQTCCTHMKNY